MITVNLNKAKEIAHELRREARSKEFEPLDEIIMKQIPNNDYQQIEAKRQKIRDKYAEIQNNINSAKTVDELKQVLP